MMRPGIGVGLKAVTAVIAWGKRPVPYRTRKLRPTAPMVLHSTGCGRVGHRRTHFGWPPVHDPDKGSRTGGPHPFKPLAHPRPTGALGTQWKHKMSQRRVGRISESLTPCRQSHTSVMVEPCRGLAF